MFWEVFLNKHAYVKPIYNISSTSLTIGRRRPNSPHSWLLDFMYDGGKTLRDATKEPVKMYGLIHMLAINPSHH